MTTLLPLFYDLLHVQTGDIKQAMSPRSVPKRFPSPLAIYFLSLYSHLYAVACIFLCCDLCDAVFPGLCVYYVISCSTRAPVVMVCSAGRVQTVGSAHTIGTSADNHTSLLHQLTNTHSCHSCSHSQVRPGDIILTSTPGAFYTFCRSKVFCFHCLPHLISCNVVLLHLLARFRLMMSPHYYC